MSFPPNTSGLEQSWSLIPQRVLPMRNTMIDDDLDDPIPRSRSNPTFETSRRFPDETQNETLPPAFPGPSSMFQRAREVDIAGSPAFVNGNVYNYNHHYNPAARNMAQTELATRRSERRVDIIKQLVEEVNELNQLLQEKTAELVSLEEAANRQNAKLTEEIKQLEAELKGTNQLLQKKTAELISQEEAANRQDAKQADDIKRFEAELRKLNQLLQEKTAELASLEEAANRQNTKQAGDIKQLEAELRKLNQLLQKRTSKLTSLDDQKGRYEKMMADMSQQKEKYEEEIRGLQSKVCNLVEDMNHLKAKHEEEIRGLQAKIYDQKADDLFQEQGIEKRQKTALPNVNVYRGQRSPSPQAVVATGESVSMSKVTRLLKTLNAQIDQVVYRLTNSLSCLEPPVSDNKSEIVIDELYNHLGPSWFHSKLRVNSELDPWITTFITLQTGLVNTCSHIVNNSPFWCNGSMYCYIYRNITWPNQPEPVFDEWRPQTPGYTLAQVEDANKKYLTEVVLKLVTVAVGETLTPKSTKSLLSQCNQWVEEMAITAAKLHKTITEEVASVELISYTVPFDIEFDASQMEDTENIGGSTAYDKVVCTQDMGLLCRQIVERGKARGSINDWIVVIKAKVVLATALRLGT